MYRKAAQLHITIPLPDKLNVGAGGGQRIKVQANRTGHLDASTRGTVKELVGHDRIGVHSIGQQAADFILKMRFYFDGAILTNLSFFMIRVGLSVRDSYNFRLGFYICHIEVKHCMIFS